MIGFSIKINLIPERALLAEFAKQRRRGLFRMAAYVRTTARNSIKRRKGDSAPGLPPYTKNGNLKRNIFYDIDFTNETLVVGPSLLPGMSGDVTDVLEHGGTIKRRSKRYGKAITATYEARPFMAPALQKSQSKLDEIWGESVT